MKFISKVPAIIVLAALVCPSCGKKPVVEEEGLWEHAERISLGTDYFIRNPVPPELVEWAKNNGGKVTPHFESEKISFIYFPDEIQAPAELQPLIKKTSATDAERVGAMDAYSLKYKERDEKLKRAIDSDPAVIEARRRFDQEVADMEKTKGLSLNMEGLNLNARNRRVIEIITRRNKVVDEVTAKVHAEYHRQMKAAEDTDKPKLEGKGARE